MRVCSKAIGSLSLWNTLKEYVETPTVVWYGASTESSSDHPMVAGHWLSNKLAHCVAAYPVNPRAGRECAILAARSTERGGNPFGRPPKYPKGIMDEKANFDGVDCGASIMG